MQVERLQKLIQASKGELTVDLVVKNARVVNVFTSEIEHIDIAIYNHLIVGVGNYPNSKQVIDAQGMYLVPGLIDAHTHIESSLLSPAEYAKVVVPHGTTAVITDPHETANVKGITAIDYLLESTQHLPIKVYFTTPTCVPATSFETAGARFSSHEVREIIKKERVVALGEVMNYPGVLSGDSEALAIILAAGIRRIDGHAPGVSGNLLNAYLMADIQADHESTELEEAREKLRKGMYVMIREGSSERNLEALLPLVTTKTIHRCMLVSDDKDCVDLYYHGHLDSTIRKAVRLGLDPLMAIRMVTLNPAEFFRLKRHGAIAPGYYADFLLVDDLEAFTIQQVYCKGRLAAKDGKSLFESKIIENDAMFHSMNVGEISEERFRLKTTLREFPVIELTPGNIVTTKQWIPIRPVDGYAPADVTRDLLLLASVERHRQTGNISVGLVKGFGLQRGALASSVAHDSHNIIVAGANPRDMYAAVRHLEMLQGGLVVVNDGQVLADLALPIGGLLSTFPALEVIQKKEILDNAAHELGVRVEHPFMQLSFLALPVIPEIRVTDRGLFDVKAMEFINLNAELQGSGNLRI